MKALAQSPCPLCRKACPRTALHVHINAEGEVVRRATIGVIQFSHPAWVAKEGACERCWNSYRDVSRVLNFFKEYRDRTIRTIGSASRILSVATNGNDRSSGRLHPKRMQTKMMVNRGGGR